VRLSDWGKKHDLENNMEPEKEPENITKYLKTRLIKT